MTDALLEAEALLIDLPGAVSRRRLGERLGQSIADLKNAGHQSARMTALVATADLIDYGQQAHQRELIEEMIEIANSVGKSLEAADDAEALRSAVFEYSDTLHKAIATLERSVRDHWHTVAVERFQPLVGLGALLTAMNLANNLGARLAACGQQAVGASTAGPVPGLYAMILQLCADYNALQEERAAEIGEGEVGDFINALAEKRATLAMVTPEVRTWLADHAALDRLGINTRY